MYVIYDLYWFLLLNWYYMTFPLTPYYKSVLCLIGTGLGTTTIIYNYDVAFIHPSSCYPLVQLTNSFFRQYFILDLGYNIYRKSLRTDILFHHLLCGFMMHLHHSVIIVSFFSIAEIMSIWNCLPLDETQRKWGRIISIYPIRACIWYTGFTLRNTETNYIQYLTCVIGPIIMSLLDAFWFWKIMRTKSIVSSKN